MKRIEIVNLFSGIRPLLDPQFWFWAPAQPLVALTLVVCVFLFFFRDLYLLIFLTEEQRERFKEEV